MNNSNDIRNNNNGNKYELSILNIHGYHGSPENAAYAALGKQCENITSPSVDYDAKSPESIADDLRHIITDRKIDVIVGTSLGGFFAAYLSAEFNLPVILINPCLLPFLHLPRLGYYGEITSFISMFGTLTDLKNDNVCCIVGDADEIIETNDFTERLCRNDRFRRIPGGKHSGATLPLNDYFDEILPYCDEIKKNQGNLI